MEKPLNAAKMARYKEAIHASEKIFHCINRVDRKIKKFLIAERALPKNSRLNDFSDLVRELITHVTNSRHKFSSSVRRKVARMGQIAIDGRNAVTHQNYEEVEHTWDDILGALKYICKHVLKTSTRTVKRAREDIIDRRNNSRR